MRLIRGALFVLAVSFSEGRTPSTACTTEECYNVAKYFLDHMDPKVDPCDNFYDFACGRYSKNGDTDSNVFNQVANVTIRRIRRILTKNITDSDSTALQKAATFYNVCLNDETYKEDPVLPIYTKMKDLGGWPLTENTDEPNDGSYLIPLVQKARQMGFDTHAIFTVNVVPNVKNTSERLLVLTPPALVVPLNRESPTKQEEKLVTDYCTLMLLIGFQFLQYSEPEASEDVQEKLFSKIVEILRFELLLAKIYPKSYSGKDVFESYNVQTIAEIQQLYPFLNWLEFIQTILGETVTIDCNEKVILSGPKYFNSLQNVYNSLKQKKIVKDYTIWRYILYSLRVSLVLMKDARWKGCLAVTLAGFEPVIAAKYIKNYFPASDKEPVVDMVNRINKVMYRTFEKYDWINPITKENVLEKINAVVMRVAYTDEMLNDESQTRWYNSLVVTPDDYFSSVLCLIKLGLDKIASTLHEPIDRNQWPSYVSTMSVNAYYVPIENSISIPAALLQKELYSSERPFYLNYGSIGFIIGHELSHAFDNMGRFYDKYGNRNKSLWDADTTAEYEEREQCFVNQYDNYMLGKTGIHLNGMLTLGENMADNEGVTMAYKAYKIWAKDNEAEERLPGLNDYTSEQMFWISLANVWCSRLNENTLKKLSKVDPHAPAKLRVIGMVSNQESFARDFKCPEGSPMNPQKKCSFN